MPRYTNSSAQAVLVTGYGLVQPGATCDVKKTPPVRFLIDAGVLTPAGAEEDPTPTSPPVGEEND